MFHWFLCVSAFYVFCNHKFPFYIHDMFRLGLYRQIQITLTFKLKNFLGNDSPATLRESNFTESQISQNLVVFAKISSHKNYWKTVNSQNTWNLIRTKILNFWIARKYSWKISHITYLLICLDVKLIIRKKNFFRKLVIAKLISSKEGQKLEIIKTCLETKKLGTRYLCLMNWKLSVKNVRLTFINV